MYKMRIFFWKHIPLEQEEDLRFDKEEDLSLDNKEDLSEEEQPLSPDMKRPL